MAQSSIEIPSDGVIEAGQFLGINKIRHIFPAITLSQEAKSVLTLTFVRIYWVDGMRHLTYACAPCC